MQYTKARPLRENWDRMARGEVWGEWMKETGPMMGIHTTQHGSDCRINNVYEKTPADRAGLLARDIVVKVEGQPVRNYWDVGRILADKMPGQQVTVEIRRDEKTLRKTVGLIRRRRFERDTAYRRAH